MANSPGVMIAGYLKMWPRELLDLRAKGHGKDQPPPAIMEKIGKPGVYVLYRDEQPYYVGKTTTSIWARLDHHSNKPKSEYYNFWNFFSAFFVTDKKYLAELEGILIAAFPLQNKNVPKFPRVPIPDGIAKAFHRRRQREF